jgi:hypothetical protein
VSACALAVGLGFASAARAYTVAASSLFRYGNSSYRSDTGGSAAAAGAILPGATTGVGSAVDSSFANASFSFGASGAGLQDYLVFHGRAQVSAARHDPGADFEYFQVFVEGTFSETLTIPAPAGVADGTPAKLMLGWDVTGSIVTSINADARLTISARTSAPLPGTNSDIASFTGNGHYDLMSPIAFIYGTPFELTIDSSVFAGVGYNYTSSTPSPEFNANAQADFLHTATLTSASVFSAAGVPVPDFTITTASGRAFLVAVPEPEVGALLALFPVLGWCRLRAVDRTGRLATDYRKTKKAAPEGAAFGRKSLQYKD